MSFRGGTLRHYSLLARAYANSRRLAIIIYSFISALIYFGMPQTSPSSAFTHADFTGLARFLARKSDDTIAREIDDAAGARPAAMRRRASHAFRDTRASAA